MALREVIEEVREAIASGDARDANEQEAKAWFIIPSTPGQGCGSELRRPYTSDTRTILSVHSSSAAGTDSTSLRQAKPTAKAVVSAPHRTTRMSI